MNVEYTNELHEVGAEKTIASSRNIVPIVYDLIHPSSVVDLGCGHGYWLREFTSLGVAEVIGYDGDYIAEDNLVIRAEEFMAYDLNQPLSVEKKYDLALSIEVAEHLKPSSADHFVESLCQLSDYILFSAAIPGQPGHCHINANWPNYWVEKFRNNGYVAFDIIRPEIWHNEEVLLCHRQNILMFVQGCIANEPQWKECPRFNCLTLVDTGTLVHLLSPRESIKRLFRKLIGK